MQREVLNREVCCEGQVFPSGTPIEQVPLDNRESCQRSGWTSVVEVVEVAEGDDGNDENGGNGGNGGQIDQSNLTNQTDLPVADANAIVSSPLVASITEQTNTQPEDADDLLTTTDLELRVIDLLKAATPPITTKTQAREFLAANKTFRIIEGIGKASDAAIRMVLDPNAAQAAE